MPKYEVVIWWSEEDDCYLAEAPELPGCMADGETLLEAAEAIGKEIELWIDVNKARGAAIPQPKGRLVLEQMDASGKYSARVDG